MSDAGPWWSFSLPIVAPCGTVKMLPLNADQRSTFERFVLDRMAAQSLSLTEVVSWGGQYVSYALSGVDLAAQTTETNKWAGCFHDLVAPFGPSDADRLRMPTDEERTTWGLL